LRTAAILLCLVFAVSTADGVPAANPGADENAAPVPFASPAPNLIPNGDFDKDVKGIGWPDGWGSPNPGSGKSWETENGRRFLRLASQQPGQVQMLYREIKLKPGEVGDLNIAVRYRTAGVKPGKKAGDDARLLVLFRDKTGALLDSDFSPILLSATSQWTEAREQAGVPPTASRMIVLAGLVRAEAGTVDLASIACIPSAAAAKQAAPEGPLPASLLTNGDFKKADAGGTWPDGWGKALPGMSWEQEGKARFVRLVSRKPGESLMLSRGVPLPPGLHGIVLTIRFRTSGVEHGLHEWFDARTIVHFMGSDGQPLPLRNGSLDFVFTHKPAPTPWLERAQFLPVPEGAVQLQLRPGLFQAAAGTLDLAEIRVTPLSDARTDLLDIADAAYGAWKGDQNADQDRKAVAEVEARLAATGNLAPNGSFEAVSGNPSWPDDWGRIPPPGVSWEREKGKPFIRLVSQDPEKVVLLYKMVLLPPGLRGVELSLRYRTAGVTPGNQPPGDARLVVHFLDGTRVGHLENGKDLQPDPSPLPLSSAAWTQVRTRLSVPKGATKLQFMPGLWNVKRGTLDLADLRIAPLSDADAKALAFGAGTN